MKNLRLGRRRDSKRTHLRRPEKSLRWQIESRNSPKGLVRYSQMNIDNTPVLDRLADGLEAAGEDSAPLRHLSEVARK